MANKRLDAIRNADGTLPAFAWPGGYDIVYVTRDGLEVCADCANREVDASQEVVDFFILEEGSFECDDCGRTIGEDDED